MRVISIKNYSDDIRVIIQLMQYHNKVVYDARVQCMPYGAFSTPSQMKQIHNILFLSFCIAMDDRLIY